MSKARHVISVVVVCTMLLVGAAVAVPTSAAEVLFEDDFTGDLSQWFFDTSTDGKPEYFSIEDGAMVFAPVWFGNAFAGDPRWTDYALEVEFEVLEYGDWGNTRFFVRSIGLWQAYGASLTPDVLVVGRFDGNWDQHQVFRQISKGTPVGQRTTVRLEVRGNTLKFYYNGELLVETEDPDGVYPMGRVGLRADHNSIKVYSVKVTSLD